MVAPAAGLGAAAPVGAAPGEVGADHAAARPGHAHRPVHKSLKLQRGGRMGPQLPDLLKGHLPGQHHAAGAQLVPSRGGGPIQAIGLGADVDGQVRRGLAHHGHGPQVGHDGGVHAQRKQALGVVAQGLQFVVGGKGVDGHVKPASQGVGFLYGLGQRIHREARVRRAQLQLWPAHVNCVRAEAQRRAQAFHVPGGTEQFQGRHFSSSSGI